MIGRSRIQGQDQDVHFYMPFSSNSGAEFLRSRSQMWMRKWRNFIMVMPPPHAVFASLEAGWQAGRPDRPPFNSRPTEVNLGKVDFPREPPAFVHGKSNSLTHPRTTGRQGNECTSRREGGERERARIPNKERWGRGERESSIYSHKIQLLISRHSELHPTTPLRGPHRTSFAMQEGRAK